jgi:hypothetical protein
MIPKEKPMSVVINKTMQLKGYEKLQIRLEN